MAHHFALALLLAAWTGLGSAFSLGDVTTARSAHAAHSLGARRSRAPPLRMSDGYFEMLAKKRAEQDETAARKRPPSDAGVLADVTCDFAPCAAFVCWGGLRRCRGICADDVTAAARLAQWSVTYYPLDSR